MEVTEPFRALPVNLLELWEHNGWRLKVYGISREHQRPGAALLAAAKRAAAGCLPVLDSDGVHGVGFVSIHEDRVVHFISVNWWARENELHGYVFRVPAHNPEAVEDITASGMAGTVWDLQVFWFERNAWVEKVLGNPRGPDLEAYLRKCLSDQA